MTLDIHPSAINEITEAYEYYYEHAREPHVAERFLEILNQTIERILFMPSRGLRYDHDTQRVLLKKYPYQVIYRQEQETIRVLAVAHQTKEPGYWADRE